MIMASSCERLREKLFGFRREETEGKACRDSACHLPLRGVARLSADFHEDGGQDQRECAARYLVGHRFDSGAEPIELEQHVRVEHRHVLGAVAARRPGFRLAPSFRPLDDRVGRLQDAHALAGARAACLEPGKLDRERVGIDADHAASGETPLYEHGAASAERVEDRVDLAPRGAR